LPQGQIAGIKPYPNELKGLTDVFGEKAKDGSAGPLGQLV